MTAALFPSEEDTEEEGAAKPVVAQAVVLAPLLMEALRQTVEKDTVLPLPLAKKYITTAEAFLGRSRAPAVAMGPMDTLGSLFKEWFYSHDSIRDEHLRSRLRVYGIETLRFHLLWRMRRHLTRKSDRVMGKKGAAALLTL